MMWVNNDIYFNHQIIMVILVIGILKGKLHQQYVDEDHNHMMVIFYQYDCRKWWIYPWEIMDLMYLEVHPRDRKSVIILAISGDCPYLAHSQNQGFSAHLRGNLRGDSRGNMAWFLWGFRMGFKHQ